MSAYIVDREHVRFLVNEAMRLYHRGPGNTNPLHWYDGTTWKGLAHVPRDASEITPEALGQLLWDMNIKSVAARYPDDTISELPGTIGESYDYSTHRADNGTQPTNAAAVLKACDGYEYQACETEDWPESEAHAIIEAIRKRAIHCMPGYDEAPTWHVTGEGVPVEA